VKIFTLIILFVYAHLVSSCGSPSSDSESQSVNSDREISSLPEKQIGPHEKQATPTPGSSLNNIMAAPSIFAFDTKNMRIVWSDSLEDDASIVSIFGAPEIKNASSYARGHVSFVYNGSPVLIIGGIPDEQASPETISGSDFSIYNILQLKDTPLQMPASITVRNLDTRGGSVRVNPTACYNDLEHWYRDVIWNDLEMRISDDINFMLGKRHPIALTWNLGTDEIVKITQTDNFYLLSWSKMQIEIQSSSPINIKQEKRPNENRSEFSGDFFTALEIEVVELVPTVRIVTRIKPKR
jgi:hypothetical protein